MGDKIILLMQPYPPGRHHAHTRSSIFLRETHFIDDPKMNRNQTSRYFYCKRGTYLSKLYASSATMMCSCAQKAIKNGPEIAPF